MTERRKANRPLRFGLIGAGRIGNTHAANIAASPDAELNWVADPYLSSAESLVARFGGIAVEDASQIIASGDVDAIVISSATPTHVHLIEACVDARLPVLCEKPIDLDISRVDALRDKVATSGVPVALGFNQRFDPAIGEARARVEAGEIGKLEHLSIVSRDPEPPPADYIATSGGIFRDMSIHDFDLARFFMGDIVEVQAMGAQLFDVGAREHADFDTVAVTLRSAGGAVATIANSRHCAVGYDQRLEAFGPAGTLGVRNAPAGLVSASTASATEANSPYIRSFLDRYAASYALELEQFIKLAQGGRSTSPTFEDGRSALVIADAAQLSAESGNSVQI